MLQNGEWKGRTLRAEQILRDYFHLTLTTMVLVVGIYFFKFPNNFCFGGVTGIAVILHGIFHVSAGNVNLLINLGLLVMGFLFLGKSFGFRTAYVSIISSVSISLLEKFHPMSAPLTHQPILELIFAIVLPGFASALLFNMEASSGGTDILAMIIKKYSSFPIGIALFWVDLIITIAACFVFDIETGLFSFAGLMCKTVVIDSVIESANRCKYFTIISSNPVPIMDYIQQELHHTATFYEATGAHYHSKRTVILTVVSRSQAVMLRNKIREIEPSAFIMITNSSEIIGNGFQHF